MKANLSSMICRFFLIHQKSNMATTAEQSTFYIYTLMLQDLGVLVWDNVEKHVSGNDKDRPIADICNNSK